jgi:UDP-3-O-[3-hydroxymyristoyl] N-acetylglucosamine deacetylase
LIGLNELQLLQHTLAGPAVCAGVGVHSGRRARLAIRPAAPNTGIVFVRSDLNEADNRIRVAPHAVARTQLNTEIANSSGVSLSTIEHLMAAFAALDVDNAIIEVDGPEVPIMDGSALPFVQLLDRAGRKTQDAPRAYIEVLETVEVTEGVKYAAIHPCDRFEIDVEINFTSAAIGRQRVELAVTERSFRDEMAAARTFGFVQEVEALRQAGLARGGSLENAIVLDGDAILNPEGLRMKDEFVRHKALDAIGDLYVLGAPLLGRFESRYGGHALNNKLVRALAERRDAWVLHAPGQVLAEAV